MWERIAQWRKSRTWPWLIFFNVFIAADASTWVRYLGLKAQLCLKGQIITQERELPAQPPPVDPSPSIILQQVVQGHKMGQGSLGQLCTVLRTRPPPESHPDSARCSLTRSGCSWWPSLLGTDPMGPRCPGKANYPEWEYQASDWPSVSCWMTVRMTTFYHYFYVSPASHSCRNTQKKKTVHGDSCAQGLHNPSPRCNVLEDSPDRNRDGPELILLLKLVPIQVPGGCRGHLCAHHVVFIRRASDQLPQNT